MGRPHLVRTVIARVAAGFLSTLIAACAGYAADPNAELAAGGLAFAGAPVLVTEREDVTLSGNRVRATYIVRNAGDDALTVPLAFGLPEIDMLALDGATIDNPAYDPGNPTNFVGFSATVDGQPVEMFVQSQALALGLIDQTALLKQHNLPLYPLHADLGERLGALPDAAKSELASRSLMRRADGQWEPIWSLKSTLFWQQAFPAGQVRTVTIAYQPIAGSSLWTADNASALQQRFCIPDAAARELTANAAKGAPATVRWVQYTAYAGVAARGQVGQYRLVIEATGGGKAFTCRDGLTGAITGTRDIKYLDYQADGEVQVLFVE